MSRLLLIILALALPFTASAAQLIKVQVDGLVCAFCGAAVEKKLRANSATSDVLVSLEHKIVAVELKPGTDIPDADIKAQLNDAGYQAKAIERTDGSVVQLRDQLKGEKK